MQLFHVGRGPLAKQNAFNGGLIAIPLHGDRKPTNHLKQPLHNYLLLNVFRNEGRPVDGSCCVTFQYLSPDGQVLKHQPTDHVFAHCPMEDPRLFVCNNQLYISFNHLFFRPGKPATAAHLNRFQPAYIPVKLQPDQPSGKLKLVAAGQTVLPPWHQGVWEKNWMFFEHKGSMAMAYTMRPLRILNAASGEVLMHRDWEVPSRPGLEVRGGAPPVCVNGVLYFFNHTMEEIGRTRKYEIVVTTLHADSLQLIAASNPIHVTSDNIVFPVGAVYVAPQRMFLVTCGIADNNQILLHFPLAEVQAALIPV